MPTQLEWDKNWLHIAKHISLLSKDPSTKVGSVIVNNNNTQISIGYNGMLSGMSEPKELWDNREQKYVEVIHSEENNILFCPFNTKGCSIYITHEPCIRCMIRLLQVGIERVIYINEYVRKGDIDTYDKYKIKFKEFKQLDIT